ncbi:39S ribosomal protein L40, mitochondrial [Drosophila sechellia]|uniref:Large ribosomal subunit protein mL40 n=1 Tax=Drosophila sechellia TaxID=7238 RepID=B4HIA1_DROSE|nr:39S ribosomal protein L40, mitochondrial [Drosophila sechellia]EDW42616.1 GM23940 [Drosophila sechellia]
MSLLGAFARLSLQRSGAVAGIAVARCLHTTPVLCAEPLKKKKKLDPQIVKQREDRKKKKIEKQIRRLEKNARQLKPVDELEVPLELIDEKDKRQRKLVPLTSAQLEERALLKKQWAHYKHDERVADYQIIDRLVQAQNKALAELRRESEELYQAAIDIDPQLLPVAVKGPVATPPIKDYVSPDGDYLHQSMKWEVK